MIDSKNTILPAINMQADSTVNLTGKQLQRSHTQTNTMKTIKIGVFGKNACHDHALNYEHVTARVIAATNTSGIQYCVELESQRSVTRIYAASSEAHERVIRLVTAGISTNRIVPGDDVLGIHIVYFPTGWPNESDGKIRVLQAPRNVIANAAASLPGKPGKPYPSPEKPGIGIIKPEHKSVFLPYQGLHEIKVNMNTVSVVFQHLECMTFRLSIITNTKASARSLAESITSQTLRRLMINEFVTGIELVDGTKRNLEIVPFEAQSVAAV